MKRVLSFLFITFLLGAWYLFRSEVDGVVRDVFFEGRTVSTTFVEEGSIPIEELVETESLSGFSLNEHFGSADYEILDQDLRRGNGGQLTRRTLVKTNGDDSRYIVTKESYRKGDSGGVGRWKTMAFYVGDEVVFEYDLSTTDLDGLESFFEENDVQITKKSRLSDSVQIGIRNPSLGRLDGVVDGLRRLFPSALVERDVIHFTSALPSEYNGALLWNINQVGAEEAWVFSAGSRDIVIGIVDTGVEWEHPDLVSNIWVNEGEVPGNRRDDDRNGFIDDVNGWDFVDDDNDPSDDEGHGTHIAGIAGADGDNGEGIVGVNQKVSLMPLRAGDGETLTSSDIAEALRYLRMMKSRGVDVVVSNNSYGSDEPSEVIHSEIKKQEAAGILFVSAAGNDGEDVDGAGTEFPTGFDDDIIISVANSRQNDVLDSSSNYGRFSVDLAAPGLDVFSTYIDEGYAYLSGTSMAAPHVAGAVALLKSAEPSFQWKDLKSRILDTVDRRSSLTGRVLTGGRLNVASALSPSLLEFDIEEVGHEGGLVLVPDRSIPVRFSVETVEGAVVEAQVLNGADAFEVVETDNGRSFEFLFEEDGVFEIEFSAEVSGVFRKVKRTVFVGDVPDVGDGLSHYWNFDGEGPVEFDQAGEANGDLLNVYREESVLGSAARFTGSNSRMEFESEHTPLISVSAMVRVDQLNSAGHPRILNMDDYYLYISSGGDFDVLDGNSDVLKFYSDRSEEFGIWNTEPSSIVSQRWIHVAATYDSRSDRNNPSLYIDGEKRLVRVQAPAVGEQSELSGPAFVGDQADGTRGFDGLIDELRVYDRVLDDVEVATLAAEFYDKRWEGYAIEVSGEGVEGDPFVCSVVDLETGREVLENVEWSVLGDVDPVVGSPNSVSTTITLNGTGAAKVVAKVMDSSVVSYLSKNLRDEVVSLEEGNWWFESDEGELVVLYIDETGSSGYMSLFSSNSEAIRVREAISIAASGAIVTVGDTANQIGVVGDSVVTVNSEFFGPSFSEGQRVGTTGVDERDGEFRGGILDSSTRFVDALVFDGSRILITCWGENEDMALGALDLEGAFSVRSVGGRLLEGQVLDDGRFVEGTLGESETEQKRYFCRRVGVASASRIVNLSTRGRVGLREDVLIGGVVVVGGEQDVLIRGVGPGLESTFGISSRLDDPLVVVSGAKAENIESDDWGDDGTGEILAGLFERVGAFGLQSGSHDSAVSAVLKAGEHTAILRGSEDGEGVALFEIYEVDGEENSGRFVNLSTRGMIRGDEDLLIGGFVIEGEEPMRVLLRAIGPGLKGFSIDGYSMDPRLDLFRGDFPIGGNDNWSDLVPSELKKLMNGAGAFELELNSRDSAMAVWLLPGVYTAVVSGVEGSEGVSLVEVYELR